MAHHVGDTSPDLTGQCLSNGTGKSITGATLEVHVRRPDGTVITRAGVPVTPATGEWSMPLQVGDLTVAGTHRVEVQVTYAGGKVQTFGPDRLPVDPQIA